MKDHPILFKGDMVKAILDGRKAQTRRIINSCGNSVHIDRLLGEWGLSEAPQQWDGEDVHDIWRWGREYPTAKHKHSLGQIKCVFCGEPATVCIDGQPPRCSRVACREKVR